MPAPLTILILTDVADLPQLLTQYLGSDRYVLQFFPSQLAFLTHIEAGKSEPDCLVIYSQSELMSAINHLHDRGTILPLVMIQKTAQNPQPDLQNDHSYIYQPSEVILPVAKIAEIDQAIDQAITKFLNITPIPPVSAGIQFNEIKIPVSQPNLLLQQQHRLADKLRERLGYLAVYYKRDPRQFFRNLDRQQKQELQGQLRSQYRNIILAYFADQSGINDEIDQFVSTVFFSDLSVSEIVKIHMELMDEFAKQLKLEGRSEEILLDYRLTLIDIIAHLCEMYRRSVPREM